MPNKRRKKKKAKAPPPTFLQRRSTKWLFAAIITLAIGAGVGALGSVIGGDDDSSAVPTATAVAER